MNLAICNFKGYFKGCILLVLVVLLNVNTCHAQDSIPIVEGVFLQIQESSSGEGSISLYQDVLLYQLVNTHLSLNEKNGLIGFRIQINQWTGQNSRAKATGKSKLFIEKFPEFDQELVYIDYEAPYYKLRVGDFRNRNAAFEFYNQVRRYFPNSYIVKTSIEFPKLVTVNDSTEIY